MAKSKMMSRLDKLGQSLANLQAVLDAMKRGHQRAAQKADVYVQQGTSGQRSATRKGLSRNRFPDQKDNPDDATVVSL